MDCARTLQDATFKTIRVMNEFRETLFTRKEVFTSSVVNCGSQRQMTEYPDHDIPIHLVSRHICQAYDYTIMSRID